MSEAKRARTVLDCLSCPICYNIPSNTKYFQCPNGHNICEHCFQKVNNTCPGCKTRYPSNPTRNLMAEDMIANDPELEVSCRNLVHGCQFTGRANSRRRHEENVCKYMMPVKCPYGSCEASKKAFEIETHIENRHSPQEGRVINSRAFAIDTYFKPDFFSTQSSHKWDLVVLKLDYDKLYVCRRMQPERKEFQLYIVAYARPETAKKYKVKFHFGNGYNDSALSWIGGVFSMQLEKRLILDSIDCLALPEPVLSTLWTAEDSEEHIEGYTRKLTCTVTFLESPRQGSAETVTNMQSW